MPGPRTVNEGTAPASGVRIDLPSNLIDLEISTSIFTHMFAGDIPATLREIGRTVKPEGIYYNTWLLEVIPNLYIFVGR